MKEEKLSNIAILISYFLFIIIVLFVLYAFFTGDLFFIGGGIDDCISNPIWGGCDL